jgi:D-tyrosyl-tRNA(Tyr) deacylase
MRAVVQRVSRARVTVEEAVVGEIGPGFVVLVGVQGGDTSADADYLAAKVGELRIFEDSDGKMNLSLREAGGAVLAISQFTLLGDTSRGNRPSFIRAERPERANQLYVEFLEALRKRGLRVETGVFRAMMDVELVNNGPVTILIDSRERASTPAG